MSWWQSLLKFLFPPKKPTQTQTPTPPPPPEPEPVPPPPPPVGKKSLWSVTINAYPGAALQGCLNDGKNLANYLAPKGFEIHRLIDQEATGLAMEAFWRQAIRETKDGDFTVLHDSGHGSNGPSGLPDDPGQCLVTVEMRPFYASRIGRIIAEEYRGGTIVFMLDACHTETGTRFMDTGKRVKSVPWEMLDTSLDPVPSHRVHRAYNLTALARSPDNSVIEFAACQANDVTYDATINGEVQGCATRAWLDAAMELDHETFDQSVYSVLEFHTRVRTKLPNEEFPNQPQLQASDEDHLRLMWR